MWNCTFEGFRHYIKTAFQKWTASTSCWSWGLGITPTSKSRLGSTQTLLAATSDFVVAISDIPYICYDFVRQRITLPDIFCGVIAKKAVNLNEFTAFFSIMKTRIENPVLSRVMRKFICRLWLNEVSRRNRQISRRMDTHGIIVVERFATFHYY